MFPSLPLPPHPPKKILLFPGRVFSSPWHKEKLLEFGPAADKVKMSGIWSRGTVLICCASSYNLHLINYKPLVTIFPCSKNRSWKYFKNSGCHAINSALCSEYKDLLVWSSNRILHVKKGNGRVLLPALLLTEGWITCILGSQAQIHKNAQFDQLPPKH